jgi:hypothetical protein
MINLVIACMMWLGQTFGIGPDDFPEIDLQPATIEQIREIECPGEECLRPTAYKDDTIYLLESYTFYTDPVAVSFIVHDLMHHLYVHNKYQGDMSEVNKNKAADHEEANKVQRLFLKELGVDPGV